MEPRKGYNYKSYIDNYDDIFKKDKIMKNEELKEKIESKNEYVFSESSKLLKKFTANALKEIDNMNQVDKLSPKEIADYIIYNFTGQCKNIKWTDYNSAIMDRVCNILFELQDKQDAKKS